MILRKASFVSVLTAVFPAALSAAEIHGKVTDVAGDRATVAIEGSDTPSIGDKADIYFKLGDAEVSVATGKVVSRKETTVEVAIEDAPGTIAKDHLARFESDAPSPAMAAGSMTQPAESADQTAKAAKLIGTWTGKDPAGDKITLQFNQDQTVTYIKVTGAKTRTISGKYRTDCSSVPCRVIFSEFGETDVLPAGESGLFELQDDSHLKLDLSAGPGQIDGGFTPKGAVILTRGSALAIAGSDEIDVPNTFNEGQSVIEARGKPAATAAPQTKMRTKSFAGKWKVQNENADYVLTLSQQGTQVSGSYTLQGGSLTGTVRGKTLVARWRQPGNQRGGTARLALSSDGQTLSGPWAYDPSVYSSRLSGTGVWTFRRLGDSP